MRASCSRLPYTTDDHDASVPCISFHRCVIALSRRSCMRSACDMLNSSIAATWSWRQRRSSNEAVGIYGVIDDPRQVLRDGVVASQPFQATVIDRDVVPNATEARRRGPRGGAVMTDEHARRSRKVEQRLHRLDVMVPVNDVGRLRQGRQIRHHPNPARENLVCDVSETARVHNRLVARGEQSDSKISSGSFGARTRGERYIRDQDSQVTAFQQVLR